jgi:hypothetical protein
MKKIGFALFFIVALFAGGMCARFIFWLQERSGDEPHVQQPIDDCIAGAASGCVRSSIEVAQQKDFRGFHYCACVLSNGMARAYMAVDSSVHSVDDAAARAETTSPLGNDNPAVNFPVGVKHR